MSSTFDALIRMEAGLDGRTLAEKMQDQNRPTWEQYKKDNEDKLDLVSGEAKKMAEYRQQLDKEREDRLKNASSKKKQKKKRNLKKIKATEGVQKIVVIVDSVFDQ